MEIISYSEARANLKTVMDGVCNDHTPAIITRVGGEHVVMVSLNDFSSMEETLHLLGTEKNSQRLWESVAQVKAYKAQHKL